MNSDFPRKKSIPRTTNDYQQQHQQPASVLFDCFGYKKVTIIEADRRGDCSTARSGPTRSPTMAHCVGVLLQATDTHTRARNVASALERLTNPAAGG